ncbi:hypothetical protein CRUP_003560, partial [Coryphaenoides rupestris]
MVQVVEVVMVAVVLVMVVVEVVVGVMVVVELVVLLVMVVVPLGDPSELEHGGERGTLWYNYVGVLMEAAGVCELDVATRRIVGGNDSPPELDSPCQEDVGEFGLVGCCGEELRGETPGREDSPSDLREAELDPGGDAKTRDEKAFGKEVILLMHALNSLATPEEKLAALCKKYADLLEESRCIQKQVRVLQKKQSQIVKEKLHLQGEHSKAILARSKLESLCRELQRHNKTLKEENAQRSREYDDQRKEAMQHFQVTLNDIEMQMEQHSSHNGMLRQENVELADRLQKLIEQYELCEEHIDKVFKHKELQQQLMDAKLQRITELTREVEEKQQREREFLLKDATASRHKCELMKEQETQLKQQLSLYMDKFEEFQTTLAKSNEIKKLEKETTQWRTKWESNNQALLHMAEEKTLRDGHFKALQGKLELLERLCRALQKERNDLNTRLSVHREQGGGEGAEPSPEASPEPNPEVGPDPNPEVSPEPCSEASPEPNPEVGPDPNPEAGPDPNPEAGPDPTPKLVLNPAPKPVLSPAPEPVLTPTPKSGPDPNPKSVLTPTPKSVLTPTPKSVLTPTPKSVLTPTPNPEPNPEARLAEPSRVPGKNSAPRDTLETQTPGHEQDDAEGEKQQQQQQQVEEK